MTTAPPSVGPSAVAALRQLVDGPCPEAFRERVRAALAPEADAVEAPARRSARHAAALRRIAQALPPAAELCRDPRLLAALSEGVAVTDPPLYMAVLSHYALCLGSVVSLSADPARLGTCWEELASGRSKGVYLVTEIGDGSSHLGIRTTAEFDPDTREFVLCTPDAGAAKFSGVGAADIRQTGVVCARLRVGGAERGVFPFVVDLGDERGPAPGVTLSRGIGVADLPLDYALVRFHRVRLGPERWLCDGASIDARGRFHDPLPGPDARLARTLCVGQALWATLPSAMAAMARESALRALRHCLHRRTHGRLAPGATALAYRSQQHALLGALAEAFALTCAGHTAQRLGSWSPAHGERAAPTTGQGSGMAFSPWAAVDRPLAVLKACAVEGAARVIGECRQRCGLPGYVDANRLSGYHGFARAFDSAGGDNRLILLDAGRALAEESADRPAAPVPPTGLPVSHPQWWPAVARAHEDRVAVSLRRALTERTGRQLRGLELWNPLLDEARELGEAYASRLAADSLARTLAAVSDPALRAALDPLAALYGAAEARRLSGRLQSSGVLGPRTVRALPGAMDELCDRLLPRLGLFETAMGALGTTLPTPLGAADYAAALTAYLERPTEGSTS